MVADVTGLAALFLGRGKGIVGALIGSIGASVVAPSVLGASPDAGPSSFTLPNRMRISPRPLAGAEIVVVQGRIDAGPVHEPAGRHGVSALATELLASPSFGEDPRAPAFAWTLWEDPTSFANFRWIEFRSACFPEELPSLLQVLESRLGRAAAPRDVSEEEVEQLRRRAAARLVAGDHPAESARRRTAHNARNGGKSEWSE
jgi:predicted Zn-dependent peptidase